MSTLLLTHPACLGHATPRGHPERAERLGALERALADPAFDSLRREEAPAATDEQLLRAHRAEHVAEIRASEPAAGWFGLDPDTGMAPGSLAAALRAAGAVVRAVDQVVSGEVDNAFCAVRPPGHHAEPARAMGFCLFNSVAVGALHALEAHGLARVAVVDFDVHHGNGTEAIFRREPRVFFASTHQMPLYPGTGRATETGVGNIVNAPLAPFDGSEEFRRAYRDRVLPALDAFGPELVLISAGFDAHERDPLAQIGLADEDFAWVTAEIAAVARVHARGRIVSTMEGGYDLVGLSESAAAHVAALMTAGREAA